MKIDKHSLDAVQIAEHKIQGTQVAIKSMTIKKYKQLQKTQGFSEAEAILMCKDSSFVIGFIEMFDLRGRVYIVTKFAPGGDLTKFCMRFGKLSGEGVDKTDWLTEEQTKLIF